MTFDDVPPGCRLFIDANTLVYHFMPHPNLGSICAWLVKRIEGGDILGFTSTHVLSEVSHRLMTIEAITVLGWPETGVVRRLRRHPDEVKKLRLFQQAMEKVLQSRFHVFAITPALIGKAPAVSVETGLLSNDALIVTVMREHGLTDLASHDADFDRVTGITRYAPA